MLPGVLLRYKIAPAFWPIENCLVKSENVITLKESAVSKLFHESSL
jgi:hypothetical protein